MTARFFAFVQFSQPVPAPGTRQTDALAGLRVATLIEGRPDREDVLGEGGALSGRLVGRHGPILGAFDAPRPPYAADRPSRTPTESPWTTPSPRGLVGPPPVPPQPRSIVELIRAGTIDAEVAALVWLLVEPACR